MISYNLGDIVLIGFPHTDQQGISKRPEIVLYDSGDQDVLVAGSLIRNTQLKLIIESWIGKKVVFLVSHIFDLANRRR